jgi:uncharacterized protein (TIGR02145 family)
LKKSIFLSLLLVLLFAVSSCKKNGGYNNYDSSNVSKPSLSTGNPLSITQSTAICAGIISNNGNLTIYTRGICWSTNTYPTTSDYKATFGKGLGSFSGIITGLLPNTLYHVRAFAINSSGTGYGNEVTFTTQQGGVGNITDIDGNVYHTITIGSQTWMVENLRVTSFRNGDPVLQVTGNTQWCSLNSAACCNYNNDINIAKVYGRLYNWYAVQDTRNLAPVGWHIPTEPEWQTLIDYLGRDTIAGGKLKEAGISHWISPNNGATNLYGFTALPGGSRGYQGKFYNIEDGGAWWSATEHNSSFSQNISLSFNDAIVHHYNYPKVDGASVRCIMDN